MDRQPLPKVTMRMVDPDSDEGRKMQATARRMFAEHRAATPGRDDLMRRLADR